MEVERLKRLAAHLRAVLAEHGVVVPHGRALDAVAAIAGLRNWPEAQAFPDRVVASELDIVACERLRQRLLRDHAFEITPGALLWLLETAELHAVTPQRRGTERLIVTTSDSGAGALKASRIADNVIHVRDALVWGPVLPASSPLAFYVAREAARERDVVHGDRLDEWDRADAAMIEWQALLAACRAHARIELWLDPTPNEQLLGLRALDWLCREPDVVDKLFVVHATGSLGERRPQELHALRPPIVKVGDGERALAARAWTAYCQPTPQTWHALLASDLAAFPFLRRTVSLLLDELPAAGTGLGATERLLLQVVEPGDVRPRRFFHINTRENERCVFGYWQEGRILDGLAICACPAIIGLQESPFDLALMRDRKRRDRYLQSRLSLSPFGHALLAGRADFAQRNSIHRWWGGTLLTNDRLWRWDAAQETLVQPRS